jgi:hypothetical protein
VTPAWPGMWEHVYLVMLVVLATTAGMLFWRSAAALQRE